MRLLAEGWQPMLLINQARVAMPEEERALACSARMHCASPSLLQKYTVSNSSRPPAEGHGPEMDIKSPVVGEKHKTCPVDAPKFMIAVYIVKCVCNGEHDLALLGALS